MYCERQCYDEFWKREMKIVTKPNKPPIVSIIMPLYNKRMYVQRAISSVQCQTFKKWELVIVDDGSNDGSSALVPIDDDRIKLFHQKNLGPSATRNKGVSLASGEFITFLDADDWYYPYKLEKEITLLRGKNGAEWMMSAFEYENNNEILPFRIRDVNGKEINDGEEIITHDALNELAIKGWHINGICMKKSLFHRIGGFCEILRYGEITEFQIRCALAKPKAIICLTPLYRVVHVPESASQDSKNIMESKMHMIEIYRHLSQQYPYHSNRLVESSRRSLYSYTKALIYNGRRAEARNMLSSYIPLSTDTKWWKIWIRSWIPNSIYFRIVTPFKQKLKRFNKSA